MARAGFARVVTTGSIDGWSIADYKGLVSSHIVTGTGFFSDFAASFTDIFGGRSRSYGKQLRSLQAEVVNQLAEQASRVGANWVIGARIDFDEISGKGMQMFMVSAQGTAVAAEPVRDQSGTRPILAGAVSADDLASSIARARLIRSALSGEIRFTPDIWKVLAEHRVEEALIPALRYVVSYPPVATPDPEVVRQEFAALLLSVPVSAAQKQMHTAISQLPDCASYAVSLIQQYALVDLTWVRDQLRGKDFRLRHTAVQLLGGHAPVYDGNSLELMAEILEILPGAFPDRATVVDKKGLFAKQGAKQWQCSSCNEQNELEVTYCYRCLRDRRGFLQQGEVNPEMAANNLQMRIECLRSALSDNAGTHRMTTDATV